MRFETLGKVRENGGALRIALFRRIMTQEQKEALEKARKNDKTVTVLLEV